MVWEMRSHEATQVVFEHTSPAGTEGYPGTLTCSVTYCLTDENEVRLSYTATTDSSTIVSLTNHTYFNLAGKVKSTHLCTHASMCMDTHTHYSFQKPV